MQRYSPSTKIALSISDSNLKIFNLSDKITQLNLEATNQKTNPSKIDYDLKLKQVDEKLKKNIQHEEYSFKNLRNNIQFLETELEKEKKEKALAEDLLQRNFKQKEQQLKSQIVQEKQKIKQKSIDILQKVEEKNSILRNELNRERKDRQDEEEKTFQEIHEEIQGIKQTASLEKEEKEVMVQEVINVVGDELDRLQDQLTQQKKVININRLYCQIREENQQKMVRMLDDLDFMLCQELNNERKNREQNEDILLKLLEETCQKIEVQIRY